MMTAAQAIERARGEGRAALIGFLTAGFPSSEQTIAAAHTLIDNGVDIIELGLPYSDPGMDGPVLEHAGHAALAAGFRVDEIFQIARAISEREVATVIMTYCNPVFKRGVDRFADDMVANGVSGLITPDLPPEEAGEWLAAADERGLERIFLAAPSSSAARLKIISDASRGFVYAASRMGVTGVQQTLDTHVCELVERVRAAGAPRVCVGIGVSTREQASQVARCADGVIIGSVLMKTLVDESLAFADRLANLGRLTEQLAQGVRSV